MVKKYVDIGRVINTSILDKSLYKYDDLMKEVPNFNKSNGAKKIFQRKEYSIYKVSVGYIIHNTKKEFEKGHTHIKSFYKAKSLVDLATRKKLPNTPRIWEIECLLRIVNDNTYKNKLRNLLEEILRV